MNDSMEETTGSGSTVLPPTRKYFPRLLVVAAVAGAIAWGATLHRRAAHYQAQAEALTRVVRIRESEWPYICDMLAIDISLDAQLAESLARAEPAHPGIIEHLLGQYDGGLTDVLLRACIPPENRRDITALQSLRDAPSGAWADLPGPQAVTLAAEEIRQTSELYGRLRARWPKEGWRIRGRLGDSHHMPSSP